MPSTSSLLCCAALMLGVLAPDTFAASAVQWSSDSSVNTAVVTRGGDQATPKSAVTPDGGRWVAWFDNNSGNYDVYAQCFDDQGHALLATGGLLVSSHPQSSSLVNWDLWADSAGNAVIVFTDTRNGADLDVYAYRIAADGSFLWGANGLTLSSNNDFEADPMVAETSTGDFVVVWSQFSSSPVIRLQRINPGGQIQLAAGGVVIARESGASPGFADLVPGNNGQVLVSWVRDTNFFTNTKYLRVAAFTAAGTPAWAQVAEVFDAYNLPIAYSPQILADGMGGAVLCWHASNPGRGFLFDAFVQHLDANGMELFPHNGVSLANAAGMNHIAPRAAFNATTGSVLAFWSEKDGSQNLSGWSAQQVDVAGNLVWGANGLTLLPVDGATKYSSYVEALGDGAMSVMTWTPSGAFGQDQIMAICLDAAGSSVWGGTRALCDLSSAKSTRLSVSMSDRQEMVVFWEDGRNGSDDIFGQNIHPDGSLGTNFVSVDVSTISLASGGTAHLSLDAGAAFAGRSYMVLGSNTGTLPGLSGHGVHLDLNDGPYFQLTLNQPQFGLFGAFRGNFDALGRATAQVQFTPGSNPAYAGATLGHAVVVMGSVGLVDLVSETDSFDLVP